MQQGRGGEGGKITEEEELEFELDEPFPLDDEELEESDDGE